MNYINRLLHCLKVTLLILLFLTFLPQVNQAQQLRNEKALKSRLDSKFGYSERGNDERYEGLHTSQIAGEIIDVVSLTFGEIEYSLNDRKTLLVSAPNFDGHPQIGVSGRSFGLNRFYSLNLLLGPGQQKKVPLKDVLSPNFIYSENLGLYGYLGKEESPDVLIPVTVSENENITQGKHDEPIVLTTVCNARIKSLKWSYAVTRDGQCGAFGEAQEIKINSPILFPGKPVSFELQLKHAYADGTPICIKIEALPFNSQDPVTKYFRIMYFN